MNLSEMGIPEGSMAYTFPCAHCGVEIHSHTEADVTDPATLKMIQSLARSTICAKCGQTASRRDMIWSANKRAAQWKTKCPGPFRNTEKSQIPKPTLFIQVMGWKFGPRGLLMHGKERAGKSRTAYKLLERQYVTHGKSVEWLGSDFGFEFAKRYSISAAETWNWLEEKVSADILLLDDVMKMKMTDSAEAALFNLVNTRVANDMPMIITTNDTDASLCQRMTPDRGPAMQGRLIEKCEIVNFG